MEPNILILTQPNDLHAAAIAEGLERKDTRPLLWQTSDFPSLTGESVAFGRNGPDLRLRGAGFDLERQPPRTVWHRRPLSQPDDELLHPSDRAFARQCCETFRRSFFELLAPEAFWVNPAAASKRASQKILQQQAALACGFAMPDTLYSNDPEEIRAFLASHGGRAIFKVLTGAPWRDGRTRWVSYAAAIGEADLVGDEILRQTPSLYQAIVEKACELRVTILGREVVTARILSQETKEGRLDWRRAYRELRMEEGALPAAERERCFALMERLGIVFGCFDFIVTPEGENVFLEVNEMGQFLFVEEYTGLPLLDAFCDFLIAADPGFVYRPSSRPLRFADLASLIGRRMQAAGREHVQPASQDYTEPAPRRRRAARPQL